MTHRRAIFLMVLVTLLWSIAGVVTRHLEAARSFEVTFWRSFFTALSLMAGLFFFKGHGLWVSLRGGGRWLWLSGICWAVMFTAFMLALTLTSVANVLVMMALGPLVTALFSRIFLGYALPGATWLAIVVAGFGVAWMFAGDAGSGFSLAGVAVAGCVALAGAANWTLLQAAGSRQRVDMMPAVLIGALLSALMTLPLAWPLQASAHDVGLLGLLGVVQLALPCLLVVRLSRELPAAEIALLGLLEVVFGVTWAWLWGGETPSSQVLVGGLMVLLALVANELLGFRRRQLAAAAG
jgi:drug/metabolite transporter (DMT)-like permease